MNYFASILNVYIYYIYICKAYIATHKPYILYMSYIANAQLAKLFLMFSF